MSQRNIYSSVDQICFMQCLQVTPHDLYSTCRVCGKYNQEKKSPADYERERDAAKYKAKYGDEPRKGTVW